MSQGREPLLIEWSPKRVRVYDPAERRFAQGAALAECGLESARGREAVVGISRRSAFIRSLEVPKLSNADTAKLVGNQLSNLLPLDAGEYVYGFRVGATPDGGRLAVVGAIKTASLRKIFEDASALGIRIKAALPVAFGSWLAARERFVTDCAVVEPDGENISIDIISSGEMIYSRTIAQPANPDALQEEVARTFTIAKVPPSPIFSTGCPGIDFERMCDKEPIQYLADLSVIRKHLFSFERPGDAAKREANDQRWKAVRASLAAVAAIAITVLAITARTPAKPTAAASRERSALRAAQSEQTRAKTRLENAQRSSKILDVAFNPGQSVSDVITVLSQTAGANVWFTSVTVARGMPLSISGLAMSDADLAKLASALSSDPRFQEVKVASSNKALIGKKQVSQFLILGKVRGLLAYDRPPKERKAK